MSQQIVRLTMAQALVRYLAAQRIEIDGGTARLVEGVFAIFGHGNVAGLGEALASARDELPTLRGHNEQSMAHAAIAFAKANHRRRCMAVTTSIGPGATNLVTAAATAHVNRLPLLLLPGDIFVSRRPDPVLQQLEVFGDPTLSVNDCLKPVSRYWDRITAPEQLLVSLPAAMQVLTDPAATGTVTLALPQDAQTFAYDYPVEFFAPHTHHIRRPNPDLDELARVADIIAASERPLIIAGGGVHYSDACAALSDFADAHHVPVAETQAGKSALPWDHEKTVGAVGVTGTSAANLLAAEADVVIAVGTRLSDFTTGSRKLFCGDGVPLVGLNVLPFDAHKHGGAPLVCDARRGLQWLSETLGDWRSSEAWVERGREAYADWLRAAEAAYDPTEKKLPSDAQVLGAINRQATVDDVILCAAGGLPGEMHKLWHSKRPGDYHLEYGYSCMGYEIAGGLGVKLARPDAQVVVVVGDGSYMMLNSDIATSVMLGHEIVVVVLDNHGFGCINRLQQACGGVSFNNLLRGADGEPPPIDFVAHAAAMGARAEKVDGIAQLEAALGRAREARTTCVVVIETDPQQSTTAGGAWWDVAVPEVSSRSQVRDARAAYVEKSGTR